MSFPMKIASQLIACLVPLLVIQVPSVQSHEPSMKATVIVAEKVGNKVAFFVNAKEVKEILTPLAEDTLSSINRPIVIIVDSELPSQLFWDIMGAIGKTSLENLKYYVRFKDVGRMAEIRISTVIPVTTDPDSFK